MSRPATSALQAAEITDDCHRALEGPRIAVDSPQGAKSVRLQRVPPKYPLQALEQLREGEFEQRAAELARLQLELKCQEVRMEVALRARHEAQATLNDFARETSDKVSAGSTSVLELQQRGRWQSQLQRCVQRANREEALARQSLVAMRTRFESAQWNLSQANADRRAVNQHRERWQQNLKDRLEERAEEERDDWARARASESRPSR